MEISEGAAILPYLRYIRAAPLQKQLKSVYAPFGATVEFGSLATFTPWLGPLEKELQQALLGNLLGSTLETSRDHEKKRIRQAAWYVMEMIRVLTDDFTSSSEIYKCPIMVVAESQNSEWVLSILPINTKNLIINLQWRNET